MKLLLILVNLLLAIGLAVAGMKLFGASGETVFALGKDRSERDETRTAVRAGTGFQLPEAAAAAHQVVSRNVFALDRCPSLASSGSRESQMELVGVYLIGTSRGAVILQSSRSQNDNNMAMMMGPGGGPGGPGGFPPWMRQRRQQVQAEQTAKVPQFFRVGETLPNGWKLSAVGATTATLSRNGSERTLELASASKNLNTGSTSATAGNTGNNRRDAMMQQMMMFQMMQMNMGRGNRNRNTNTPSARGGNTGGNTGNRAGGGMGGGGGFGGGMGGGPPGR